MKTGMKTRWSVALAAAATLAFGMTSPAAADAIEDLKRCAAMNEPAQADDAIGYCTAAIDAGELGTRNLATAHYNRGNAHRRLGNYSAAAADFTKAIEIWPELDQAWNNRGGVYARLCRTDAALADFEKAMELDPEWVKRYQAALKRAGVDVGLVDGKYGPKTRTALISLIEAQCRR